MMDVAYALNSTAIVGFRSIGASTDELNWLENAVV